MGSSLLAAIAWVWLETAREKTKIWCVRGLQFKPNLSCSHGIQLWGAKLIACEQALRDALAAWREKEGEFVIATLIACENIPVSPRSSSLGTFRAAKSEEKRMFSQANCNYVSGIGIPPPLWLPVDWAVRFVHLFPAPPPERPREIARWSTELTVVERLEISCTVYTVQASWRIVPRQCKGIQESLGFWIPRGGFRITGTGFRNFCWCNMDSRLQSLVGSGFLQL